MTHPKRNRVLPLILPADQTQLLHEIQAAGGEAAWMEKFRLRVESNPFLSLIANIIMVKEIEISELFPVTDDEQDLFSRSLPPSRKPSRPPKKQSALPASRELRELGETAAHRAARGMFEVLRLVEIAAEREARELSEKDKK